MALDGIVIAALCAELNDALVGGRIDKIHQPERGELLISVRAATGGHKLLLCANPSFPRIHLTDTKRENPATPPMFCMLLRKHIAGGKILQVRQQGLERIVHIDIETRNELGELGVKSLIIELMGKHSNIILTDESGRIHDSIYHVDITMSAVRQVLPGLTYVAPPSQDKHNPLLLTQTEIAECLDEEGDELSRQLVSRFTGISPLVAREAAHRALGRTDITPQEAGKKGMDALSCTFFELANDMKEGKFYPCVLTDATTGAPMEFSALEITQYGSLARCELAQSMNQAVEDFYRQRAENASLKQKSGDLTKFITLALARCRKKLQIQNETLEKVKERDKYKMRGDLITANLHRIKKGDKHVTVENYFAEDMAPITIPLAEDLSPSQNAQRCYSRYNKDKTAEVETAKQRELNLTEISYFESVLEEIERACSTKEIEAIRDELIEQGYLKNRGRLPKKAKKDTPTPRHYVSSDGYDIYVGRNNRQNDYVTCKLARGTDLWFHTKGIHGAHVLAKNLRCHDGARSHLQPSGSPCGVP